MFSILGCHIFLSLSLSFHFYFCPHMSSLHVFFSFYILSNTFLLFVHPQIPCKFFSSWTSRLLNNQKNSTDLIFCIILLRPSLLLSRNLYSYFGSWTNSHNKLLVRHRQNQRKLKRSAYQPAGWEGPVTRQSKGNYIIRGYLEPSRQHSKLKGSLLE